MKKLSHKQKLRSLYKAKKQKYKKISREIKLKLHLQTKRLRLKENSEIYKKNGFKPPKDKANYPIFSPSNMCLWTNYEETARFFANIRKCVFEKRQPVIIHLDKLQKIDHSSALVLVSEIYRCKNLGSLRGKINVTGTYPKDKNIHRLLAEMGFFRLLGVIENIDYEIDRETETIFWKFQTYKNVDTKFISDLVGLVEKYVVPMNQVARQKLVAAIKEAMSNTLDHAYGMGTHYPTMSDRWFLSMKFTPERQEVGFVLFDQGIGIPASIDLDLFEAISARVKSLFHIGGFRSSEGEMIRIATHKYRTRTDQKGRGRGFEDMKNFARHCENAVLRIRSNRGYYCFADEQEISGDDSVSVGGTLIEFTFRSQRVDMSDD